MADLKNPRLIFLKGFLFLLGGILASVLLLVECPSLQVALLLALTVWCYARFYYFAFYVIEHYVDPSYKFSGLGSFLVYLLGGKKNPPEKKDPGQGSTSSKDK